MLARLFVAIGGLVVLALTAALVGPYFVDWTSYRADFEAEASRILGRKVTVEGQATARLLPFPSVTFSDVSVAGVKPGEPAVTVETFSMDAELAPFMRGEFLIFDMRLVRPRAIITVDADGKVDWAMRPSSPFEASQITLEKLTVTDGQITIRHAASGRDHLLSEVNTSISAKSLSGPWRADGTALIDGMPSALAVSTGKVDEAGSMRLRIKIDPATYPITIEADGTVKLDEGAAQYAGSFKMDAADRQEQLRGSDGTTFDVAKEGKPVPAAYRTSGKFSVDYRGLGIDAFRFETGSLDNPYTAEGTAFVDFGAQPRFAIQANGAQVQFDEALTEAAKGVGVTLNDRITGLRRVLAGLPKPSMPGTVDVNLPAVLAGDTTIRDVKMSAEPVSEGWSLKTFAATLPGRTTLEGSGLLRTGASDFGFSGSLLLAVGQPSGFAAWLSRDVDDAIRRLPAAGFKASVDITEQRQTFNNLELVLGDAKFRGKLDNEQPDNASPSMSLHLDGGALDVDGLTAFVSLFVNDAGATRLDGRDLDLAVKAGPLVVKGLNAETVDAALRVRGGQIEIDRLSIGGLGGSTLSATGTIKDFATDPVGKVDATIVSVDLAPLLSTLATQFPGNVLVREFNKRALAHPGLFEDTQLDMVATSAKNDDGTTGFAMSASGKAGGSDVTWTASAKGALVAIADAPVSLSFSARNDDAGRIMALYGVPALPLGMTGAAETTLTASGQPSGSMTTDIDFSGQDAQFEFHGAVGMLTSKPSIKGTVRLEAADLEPWLMTAGVGLPGMGLGLPVSLAANADYASGLLVLSELDGTVADGELKGDLNVAMKDGVPYVTGALSTDAIDLEPAAAMVLGEAALTAEGSEWPQLPFQSKVQTPFTMEIGLTAASISAGDSVTLEDASMVARLDAGGARISDLKGTYRGGKLDGLFEMKNNDGTGLLTGQFKLAGADLEAVVEDGGLSGTGDISASLSASGKSAGAMVASLSGSGSATVHGIRIAGVNPDALPALLLKADGIGRDIDSAKVATFAPEPVATGDFSADDADIAFTVAGGILRAPPVTLVNEKATLTADLKADMNSGIVSVDGTIAYVAGDEAQIGSEPAIRFKVEGPLGATEKVYDTEPLAQFLTQRALEKEQARVEAMQAALLEKQRLRREVRYYAALQAGRDRAAEALRKADEVRLQAEAEARQRAEEEIKAKAEQDAKATAEEQARLEAESEARKQDAAKAAQADAQTKAKANEEQRRKVEQAIKLSEQERAASEVAAKPVPRPQPKVERAPLPEAAGGDASATGTNADTSKPFKPFSIDGFFKSLQGTQ